jgi:uroporphyrin-III C-methyltransferase
MGRVWLVGAGPGSVDLLTLGAAQALARAEVIVHDALVGEAVFALVPPGVDCIDVGKRPGAAVAQEEINELLVSLAQAGRQVVRLKGGDPYLFGRGGEEALALQDAGVPFEVVPGVSSALAAPALAGVPVTHRGVSVAVTVITGHRAGSFAPVDWEAVARVGGTLVVLMGVTERAAIAAGLRRGGLAPDTPVAIIERASRPDSAERRTTLGNLAATAVQAPAVLVIGSVAALDLRSVAEADIEGATG